jgi:hypothetical protein
MVHRSEVVVIEGESWRLKEAKERGERRKKRALKTQAEERWRIKSGLRLQYRFFALLQP